MAVNARPAFSRLLHAGASATMIRAMRLGQLILLLPILALSACDSGGDGGEPMLEIESDAGEAVIRHLIAKLPDPSPGVPKVFAIAKGEIFTRGVVTPVSTAFHQRFDDLKLRFVSANSLEETEPDHMIVDSQSRLAPYLLQVRKLVSRGAGNVEAEVGWAYKKHFERWRYTLEQREGKAVITTETRLAGNWDQP